MRSWSVVGAVNSGFQQVMAKLRWRVATVSGVGSVRRQSRLQVEARLCGGRGSRLDIASQGGGVS
jgi:hypothetical protein